MKTNRVTTLNAGKLKTLPLNIVNWKSLFFTVSLLLVISCATNDDLETTNDELLKTPTSFEKKQSSNMVLTWNKAMQDLYTFPIGIGTPPISTAYTWALVHLAMHDALNSITPRYETFVDIARDKDADPDTAVAQAAYDILMAVTKIPFAPAFVPQNLVTINTLLESSLNAIPDGDAKTKGIALGHAVAQGIMAKRASDLPNLLLISPNSPLEGNLPGEYRYVFLPPAPNGKGIAFPDFGKLQPIFMTHNDMYRPKAPYTVNSPEYASDFNETKDYGADISSIRTASQTEIGLFWAENSNRGWNDIARQVLESYNPQSQNVWKTARYFALLHGAILDTYISTTESKLYYYTWRPEDAVHRADTDGNANTVADLNWKPLLPTPPVPEYPAVLSFAGSAVGQLIFRYFDNKDNYVINHTSGFVPGVTRTYASITEAIKENTISSIYNGFHFRLALEVGEALGYNYADFVYENALKEKP